MRALENFSVILHPLVNLWGIFAFHQKNVSNFLDLVGYFRWPTGLRLLFAFSRTWSFGSPRRRTQSVWGTRGFQKGSERKYQKPWRISKSQTACKEKGSSTHQLWWTSRIVKDLWSMLIIKRISQSCIQHFFVLERLIWDSWVSKS